MPLMNMQWSRRGSSRRGRGSFSQGTLREWGTNKDGFGLGKGVFSCTHLDG